MKRLRYTLAALGTLGVVVCGSLLLFPETIIRSFVVPIIEDSSGYTVTFDHFSFSWRAGVNADEITVADNQGEWLRITHLAIVPRWWSLTGDHPHIDIMKAERVELRRLPESPPTDESEPYQIPDIPMVSVDRLTIARFDLPSSMTGAPISLRADGGRQVKGEGGESALRVSSLEGVPFSLSYRGDTTQGDERFDLRYEEEGGGPVGRLSPSIAGRAVSCEVTGKGWGGERNGAYRCALESKTVIEGGYTLRTDTLRSLTMEGRIHPGLLVSGVGKETVELVAARIEAPLDFSSITLPEVQFSSAQGSLRAHGLFDFDKQIVDLSLNLDMDDLSRLDATLGGGLEGSLKLDGDMAAPMGETSFRWVNASMPGLSSPLVTISGKGVPVESGVTTTFVLKMEPPTIEGTPQDATPIVAEGSVHLSSAGAMKVERLHVTARDTTLDVRGERSVAGNVKGSAQVMVGDLGRWVAGQKGGVSLHWNAEGTDTPFTFTGPLRLEKVTLASLAETFGADGGATASLRLDETGLILDGITVTTPMGSVEGDADYRWDRTSASADLSFDLHETDQSPVEADGKAHFTLRETANSVAWNGEVTTGALTILKRPFDKGVLTLDGQGNETVAGTGRLALMRKGTTASLNTTYRYHPSPGISFKGEGAFKTSQLSFEGAVGAKNEGSLTFDAHDLRDIGQFLDLPLGGALAIKGSWKDNRLKLNGKGRSLWYTDVALDDFQGEADLSFIKGKPVGSFDATSTYLATTDMVLTAMALTGKVDEQGDGAFSVAVEGYRGAPFSMRSEGSVAFAHDNGSVKINQLTGDVGGYPITLLNPLSFGWSNNGSSLSGSIGFDKGKIAIDGGVMGKALTLSVTGDRIPLGVLSRFDVLAVEGEGAFGVTLGGMMNAPTIDAHLESSTLRPLNSTVVDPPTLTLSVKGGYQSGKAEASLALTGGDSDLRFNGVAPFNLSLAPFAATLDTMRTGHATTTFDVNLDDLIGMAPRLSFGVAGKVKGNIRLTGRMDNPQADGDVVVHNGRFLLYDLGGSLHDIEAAMKAKDGRLSLTRFSSSDGAKGTFGMTGDVLLSASKRFPYRFVLSAMDAALVKLIDLTAHANGDLLLEGDGNRLAIAGRMTLDPVSYTWAPSSAPDIPTIEVEEINLAYAPKQRAGVLREEPFKTVFALDLILPGPARLEGPGIDSFWEGELYLGGDHTAPLLDGSLRLTRGRFDLFGSPLKLVGGEALFQKEQPINPSLDFHAVSKTTDLQIDLFLTGTAASPNIAITSSPALPESEAMSALLFGRSMSGVTPLQAVQVAQALKVLSGDEGGSGLGDLLKSSRRLLNLADLRLIQSADNPSEYGLSVGTYIGSGAYVEAEQSLAGRGTKVTVEVEVTDNVTLDTQVGENAQSGIGVNWKRDY